MAGGYKEFFVIAIPLIISTSSWGVQHFIHRLFLSHYSVDTFAAVFPAGILHATVMSIFVGTVVYVDVFVAQYWGKGEKSAIGPAVWQSVYLAFVGGLIVLFVALFAEPIFSFIAHAPEIQVHKVTYFQTLAWAAFPSLAATAMGGFYAGRGKTRVIVAVNVVGVLVAVLFDWLLIFGRFGFPELGIRGAGIASILGAITMASIYVWLITRRQNSLEYNTRIFKPDFTFIKKLIKFGFPNGVQFFFDIASFTFFVLVVGTLGRIELTASTIAFTINSLAYLPLSAFGITVSILVGQYLGRNKADIAETATYTGLKVAFVYAAAISLAYVLFAGSLVDLFLTGADAYYAELIRPAAIKLLMFICVYTMLDPLGTIFSSAIKGAGDTAYIMKALIVLSVLILALPAYTAVALLDGGLYTAWTIFLIHGAAYGLAFYKRFLTKKWAKMRVIDMKVK